MDKLGGVKQFLTLLKVYIQAYKNKCCSTILIACQLSKSTGTWKSQSYIHPERNSVGLNKVWPKQISHRHTIVRSFVHSFIHSSLCLCYRTLISYNLHVKPKLFVVAKWKWKSQCIRRKSWLAQTTIDPNKFLTVRNFNSLCLYIHYYVFTGSNIHVKW